ncbi:MAG: glycoside hydrolase family 11 protein [Fibromonadaceae bacterium]|nr:glycoside hydrolase family 11 protein [Fibromonadaceae bacterium]
MKKVAIALCLAITFAVPAFGQDPCSQTTKLSGGTTWNGTKGATVISGSGDDAIGVEAWTEAGGDKTKLTWYGANQGGGSAFRAEWTNSTDYLGRVGYQWGTNGKKWNNLGDLCVDYNYTRSGVNTGGSYSYIGIYGWTIGSSNSAEFYIVEDWFGNGQQAANNLGNNCQTHNNITVDGRTYQVVTCIRPQGSGCVSCNNQAFGQVFSIRQGMAQNTAANKCGTISIKKHFEEWIKQTTEKGGQSPAKYIYDKTYESKFLVEAAGGTGWFEASWMKFSRTGACGGTSGGTSSAAVSSSSRASSSSVAASSSSRAASSSSAAATGPAECGEYKTSFCGGLAYGSVPSNSTTMPTTGNCLYIGDFEQIQPNLNSTVAINGMEVTLGSAWADSTIIKGDKKPATKDGGYYVFVKTGTINSYQNNGWKGIVAKTKPACTTPSSSSSGAASSSSSSEAGDSSSSSEDATPIISHSPLATSHSPTYYSLKGEPLGNAKPTKAGIYIVKRGSSIQKIAVR